MKTALVLTGMLRDFRTAYPFIKEHILNRFSPDVYFSIWDDFGYWAPGNGKDAKGFKEAGKISKEDILRYYPGAELDIEVFDQKEQQFERISNLIPEYWVPELQHSNCLARRKNTISMYYKIRRGVQLLTDQIKARGTHYDVVIRTRPDLCIRGPLPEFNPQYFYSLHHRNHLGGGIGDIIHMSTLEAAQAYSLTFEYIIQLFKNCNNIFCPHLLSEAMVKHAGLALREFEVPFTIMNTPAGAYMVEQGAGKWLPVGEAQYEKVDRFRG